MLEGVGVCVARQTVLLQCSASAIGRSEQVEGNHGKETHHE